MIASAWLWIGFALFIVAMLALDLGVFHRKAHAVSFKKRWAGARSGSHWPCFLARACGISPDMIGAGFLHWLAHQYTERGQRLCLCVDFLLLRGAGSVAA